VYVVTLEEIAKLRTRVELTTERGKKVVEMGGHCWQDGGSKDYIGARYEYYATRRNNATLECNSVRIDAGIKEYGGGIDTEAGASCSHASV
jgi:hypothetical protein